MHTCARCGREATSIGEIHNGCPCGTKVFVFNKDAEPAASQAPEQTGQAGQPSAPEAPPESAPITDGAGSNGGKGNVEGGQAAANPKASDGNGNISDGRAPESSSARATFSSDDVENIKIVSEGVFFVDVNALSKNPVVLKDEEGVYYVRLPLSKQEFDEDGKGGKPQMADNGKLKEENGKIEAKKE